VAGSASSGVHDLSAGQLKARARGSLSCALLGSAWMYWAVVFSGHPTPTWFSAVTLPAIALTAWAILRIQAFRHLVSSPADVKHWKAFRNFLWIDSDIEWGLAGVGTFLLSRSGRFDLIPLLFGVIIGLHFLPFARLFRLSHHYWVGGIMIVGEAGSLLIPRRGVRNIAGCAAIGFALWVTGLIILRRISLASRSQTVSA
jgi:hypothetical protein